MSRVISNPSSRSRLWASIACSLFVCGGVLFVDSAPTPAHPQQQDSLQIYTLDTGWGTVGADVSPDGRFVAIDAVKGSAVATGTEVVEEVQIWSFRDRKLVTSKELSRHTYPNPSHVPSDYDSGYVRYAASGSKLIVYWKRRYAPGTEAHLLVLDSKTLDDLQNIDLSLSSWPRFPPSVSDFHSFVRDVQVDERGQRAAVLLEWSFYGGGELRVYDLSAGVLLKKWDFEDVGFGKMSIDPKGRRTAIPVLPFPPGERNLRAKERNLRILDVDSGKTVSEINTGYLAGAVAFIGEDKVATVSANPDVKHFNKDTIKIWDVETGRLIRQISSEPGGVHDKLLVSADGRVALGYVGLDKLDGPWWTEQNNITVYQRFRLWNLSKDEVIATSPDLPELTGSAFALSAKGDIVLIHPVARGGPLRFYEIRSSEATAERRF